MAKTFAQARLQGVVGKISDARNHSGGGKHATARWIIQSAARMETSLISVARCGKGSTAAIKSRHVDGRIAFDEARQLRSFRPHISDFQQEIVPEGVLNI